MKKSVTISMGTEFSRGWNSLFFLFESGKILVLLLKSFKYTQNYNIFIYFGNTYKKQKTCMPKT